MRVKPPLSEYRTVQTFNYPNILLFVTFCNLLSYFLWNWNSIHSVHWFDRNSCMHSHYIDSLIVLIADIYATHRLFQTITNFMQLKHWSLEYELGTKRRKSFLWDENAEIFQLERLMYRFPIFIHVRQRNNLSECSLKFATFISLLFVGGSNVCFFQVRSNKRLVFAISSG